MTDPTAKPHAGLYRAGFHFIERAPFVLGLVSLLLLVHGLWTGPLDWLHLLGVILGNVAFALLAMLWFTARDIAKDAGLSADDLYLLVHGHVDGAADLTAAEVETLKRTIGAALATSVGVAYNPATRNVVVKVFYPAGFEPANYPSEGGAVTKRVLEAVVPLRALSNAGHFPGGDCGCEECIVLQARGFTPPTGPANPGPARFGGE